MRFRLQPSRLPGRGPTRTLPQVWRHSILTTVPFHEDTPYTSFTQPYPHAPPHDPASLLATRLLTAPSIMAPYPLDAVPPALRTTALLAVGCVYAAVSVRTAPPGVTRFLLSLPLMLLFSYAPIGLSDSVMVTGGLGFLLSWLASFKCIRQARPSTRSVPTAAACKRSHLCQQLTSQLTNNLCPPVAPARSFACNRGPLAIPGLSPATWLLLLLLPFFPLKRGHPPARGHHVLLGLLVKAGAQAQRSRAIALCTFACLAAAHKAPAPSPHPGGRRGSADALPSLARGVRIIAAAPCWLRCGPAQPPCAAMRCLRTVEQPPMQDTCARAPQLPTCTSSRASSSTRPCRWDARRCTCSYRRARVTGCSSPWRSCRVSIASRRLPACAPHAAHAATHIAAAALAQWQSSPAVLTVPSSFVCPNRCLSAALDGQPFCLRVGG